MKQNIYVVRDEVSLDNSILLSAVDVVELKRNIKAVMCSPANNIFKDRSRELRIFKTAELETSTGMLNALPILEPVFPVELVRKEIEAELLQAKNDAIDVALSKGLDKDKAEAYMALLESLDFFGLETNRERDLKQTLNEQELQINLMNREIDSLNKKLQERIN